MFRWFALVGVGCLGLLSCSTDSTGGEEPEISEEEARTKNLEAWLEAADTAFRHGQYESAAGHYHRALIVAPNSLTAMLGYGDSAVDWADQLLEQSLRLYNAGRNGTAEEFQRSMQLMNPLVDRAIRLQNAAFNYYDHVRKAFKDNRVAYLRATFGMAKIYYYRICSPHSPYAFAEVEEKVVNGHKIVEIKDPQTRDAIIHEREMAIKYLDEFITEAKEEAIEARRWQAALLVSRNQTGDKERALELLHDYKKKLEQAAEGAEKKIAQKETLKIYREFLDREMRATNDAIRMLEKPDEPINMNSRGLSAVSIVLLAGESQIVTSTFRRMMGAAIDAKNVRHEGAQTYIFDLYTSSMIAGAVAGAEKIVNDWPAGACKKWGQELVAQLKVLELEMTLAAADLAKDVPTVGAKVEKLNKAAGACDDLRDKLVKDYGARIDLAQGFQSHLLRLDIQLKTVHRSDCPRLKKRMEESSASYRKKLDEETVKWLAEFSRDEIAVENARKWLQTPSGSRGKPPMPLTDGLRAILFDPAPTHFVSITRGRADAYQQCPDCLTK
jgi:hypothetical protein